MSFSVLDNTPPELIDEIVLIDDFSDERMIRGLCNSGRAHNDLQLRRQRSLREWRRCACCATRPATACFFSLN